MNNIGVNKVKDYFFQLKEDIVNIDKSNFKGFIEKRYKLILFLILSIFLLGGYFYGNIASSKDRVLKGVEIALKTSDSGDLRKYVRAEDEKISKDELEPLLKYYGKDIVKINSTMNTLKSVGETEAFKLVEKEGLFGHKYYVEVKRYNLDIETNFNEGVFSVGSHKEQKGNTKFQNLIPGIYNIQGQLKGEYGEAEVSKEIVLMKNEEVKVNFSAVNIKVSSEFQDGLIYVNGKNTGLKVEDNKEIGPIPSDSSVGVYLEKKFPWGTIKGEEVKVRDISNINLTINMENETMKQDMNKVVKEFYNSVFDSLNNENKELIKNSTSKAKDKIYNILEKKYTFLKNCYTINSIEMNDENNQYYYNDGEYRATVVVIVDYETKKKLFSLGKSENSKSFFTKLVYEDNEWKIEDVENFSL